MSVMGLLGAPVSLFPGANWPATQSASRLAMVPLEVRWPR